MKRTSLSLILTAPCALPAGATLIQQAAGITTDPGLSGGPTVSDNVERALNAGAFTTAAEALNAIAVPEPGSLALVALGFAALIGLRKRI